MRTELKATLQGLMCEGFMGRCSLKMKSNSIQSQGGEKLPRAPLSGSGAAISVANLLAYTRHLGLPLV